MCNDIIFHAIPKVCGIVGIVSGLLFLELLDLDFGSFLLARVRISGLCFAAGISEFLVGLANLSLSITMGGETLLEHERQSVMRLAFCFHRVSIWPSEARTEDLCTSVAIVGHSADIQSVLEHCEM